MRSSICKTVAVAVAAVFLLVGCGGGGGSPSNVIKRYHTALQNGDAKTIGQLSTPESMASVAPFLEKAKGLAASYGDIVNIEEKIDGNEAVVNVEFKSGDTSEYNLTKVDGKWKVSDTIDSK